MKQATADKPRASGTVSVKLAPADLARIASLASIKQRTPHYLMKEAILDYVRREEAQQNFIKAANTSFEHYKETGLHLTLDEFNAWVDEVQSDPGKQITRCHT